MSDLKENISAAFLWCFVLAILGLPLLFCGCNVHISNGCPYYNHVQGIVTIHTTNAYSSKSGRKYAGWVTFAIDNTTSTCHLQAASGYIHEKAAENRINKLFPEGEVNSILQYKSLPGKCITVWEGHDMWLAGIVFSTLSAAFALGMLVCCGALYLETKQGVKSTSEEARPSHANGYHIANASPSQPDATIEMTDVVVTNTASDGENHSIEDGGGVVAERVKYDANYWAHK